VPVMDRRDLALRLRRVALDWVAPVVVLVIGVVHVAQQPRTVDYPGSPVRHLVFMAVAVAALGVRRRAPLLAPCLAIAVVTWWTSLWPAGTQGPFEGFVLLVGAAYCLGTIRERRKLILGAGVLVLWFLVGVAVGLVGGRAGDVVPIGVWLAIGFGVGYLISRRTEQARQAWEATRVLAAEQQRQTARAVEDERARIARELHDVVAHGLSVIVVQAVAERRSLHGSTLDTESIDAALGSIERTGREALVDLRRLLGLLRRSDDPVALSPQPGLGQLEELLGPVREAGLQVELDITGDQSPLPPGLDLTAYRIVQEALTNVLKHADARCVRVALAFQRNHLDVQVSDDGSPGAVNGIPSTGPGHGLIGMRERVHVFGGTISAGTSPGGGWTVHARLPVATVGVG
jgi:signal transduction histidine kinase